MSASILLAALLLAAAAGAPALPPSPAPSPSPSAPPSAEGHHHHTAEHRFEDPEKWARIFDDPARDGWQKPQEVVRLSEIAPGMTVADLGAGTGYFLHYLAEAVGPQGRVLALDVEPQMVRYMAERARRERLGNVEALVVDGADPGLSAKSVDRVLVVDTWHHLPDRAAYSKRLGSALKPGGRVVVVDFTLESALGPPPAARLAAEQVMAEMRKGGLEALLLEEDLPEQYVVVGRKR